MSTLTHAVRIGRTVMHPPIPDFVPEACCAACTWHADAVHDRDVEGRPRVRAAAVTHAASRGHRVVVDEVTSWTVIEVTS